MEAIRGPQGSRLDNDPARTLCHGTRENAPGGVCLKRDGPITWDTGSRAAAR